MNIVARISLCLVPAFFVLLGSVSSATEAPSPEQRMEAHVPMRALTKGPDSHWFAYYDKHQFDVHDRYALGMMTTFEDRSPHAQDSVVLGMVDLQEGDAWIPFAETTAWCWQQGCMLQWLPGSESEVIYNVRNEDGYDAVIQDVFTGEKRRLPKPVYTVSPDGNTAMGLNFARLGETRPGYGYNGMADPFAEQLYSAEDGMYAMDLRSGECRTIISLERIALMKPDETVDKGKHWFNHLLFSPDGARFIFLHRWHRETGKGWYTRGFTARPDGSAIHCFNANSMVSHFIWRDSEHLLAWSREPETGNQFHIYRDMTDHVEVVAPALLKQDGHCTYSPCGEWILTDTYPDRNRMQTLLLFRPADNSLVTLGRFYQAQPEDIQLRCDLHPRWNRSGTMICIDSKWSGQRQMYLLDVGEIIKDGRTETK